jgi:hypothetical protein
MTHSDGEGHDTLGFAAIGIEAARHAAAPAVGSLVASTWPPAAATHSETDGQEMPVSACPEFTEVTVHFDAPPVGSVDVTVSPL